MVTELGGLLSHGMNKHYKFLTLSYSILFSFLGAVVAREYGLPCIVGAQQATTLIKTGCFVRSL